MLYSILTWNKPDMVLQRTILPASYGIWGRQKCLGPCSQAFQFVAMGEMDNVMHVQATDSKSKRAFVVCFLTCSRSFRKSLVHGRLFRRKLLYFEVDRINLRAGRNVASVEDQPETPVSEDGSPNAHHHPEKSLITGSLLELEDPVRKNDFGTSSQAVAQNLKETKAKPGRVMLISPWTDRVTPRARGVILMNILTFLYGKWYTDTKSRTYVWLTLSDLSLYVCGLHKCWTMVVYCSLFIRFSGNCTRQEEDAKQI